MVDGGRLLMDLSLRGLSDLGHRVTLVAPDRSSHETPSGLTVPDWIRWIPVSEPFRAKAVDLVASWPRGRAFSITRHRSAEVGSVARRLLDEQDFDVAHVEQVQALGNVSPRDFPVPVVLRAQNVESDLWRMLARHRPWIAPALRLEARLLAREEGRAVRTCGAVAALTSEDAERLGALAGEPGVVRVIPPPFPDALPPGERVLEGDPALVVFGSSGWIPNRQGLDWWVREIWPYVADQHPGAILHIFGAGEQRGPRIVWHEAPVDSREAFPPRSVLLVPLRMASGIRMEDPRSLGPGCARDRHERGRARPGCRKRQARLTSGFRRRLLTSHRHSEGWVQVWADGGRGPSSLAGRARPARGRRPMGEPLPVGLRHRRRQIAWRPRVPWRPACPTSPYPKTRGHRPSARLWVSRPLEWCPYPAIDSGCSD